MALHWRLLEMSLRRSSQMLQPELVLELWLAQLQGLASPLVVVQEERRVERVH